MAKITLLQKGSLSVKDKTNTFLLTFIFIYAYIIHFLSLNQTPFSNGWDSYFYLIQVKTYIEEGQMCSDRTNLLFPIVIVMQKIINNYELVWKLFVALCSALIPVGFYQCIKASKNLHKYAFWAAGIGLASPHLFYFQSQYGKNLLGFSLFLFAASFLYKKKYIIATALCIASAFSHKLTGVLAIVLIGIYALDIVKGKLSLKQTIMLLVATALIITVAGYIFRSELLRQDNLIETTPYLTLEAFLKTSTLWINRLWKAELLFTFTSVFLVFIVGILKKKSDRITNHFILLFILLNFPFLAWDQEGFSYRFFMLGILFLPLILIKLFYLFEIKSTNNTYSVVISIIFGTFSIWTYNPVHHDPPFEYYKNVTNRLVEKEEFTQAELIICHKALSDYIKFTTGTDAMSWQPEYKIHRDSLWRLSCGVPAHTLRSFVGKEEAEDIVKINSEYTLLKETTWKNFTDSLQKVDEGYYKIIDTWENPKLERPAFLMKYKRK